MALNNDDRDSFTYAGRPRVKKPHHKVRTGCVTCRTRRVKCDEQKPYCSQCLKSSRRCLYRPLRIWFFEPASSITDSRVANLDAGPNHKTGTSQHGAGGKDDDEELPPHTCFDLPKMLRQIGGLRKELCRMSPIDYQAHIPGAFDYCKSATHLPADSTKADVVNF